MPLLKDTKPHMMTFWANRNYLVSLRNPKGMKERPGDGSGGETSYVLVLHGIPKQSQRSLQKLGITRGTLMLRSICAAPACFQEPDLSATAAESRLAASHARPYHSLCLLFFLLCTLLQSQICVQQEGRGTLCCPSQADFLRTLWDLHGTGRP